jgi:hypothetical protein
LSGFERNEGASYESAPKCQRLTLSVHRYKLLAPNVAATETFGDIIYRSVGSTLALFGLYLLNAKAWDMRRVIQPEL